MQNTFWRKVVALGQVSMTGVLVASESEAHPSPLIQTMMLGENRVDHFWTNKDHAKCSTCVVLYVCTCVHVYMYVCMYVCTCMYMCSFAHMYITLNAKTCIF